MNDSKLQQRITELEQECERLEESKSKIEKYYECVLYREKERYADLELGKFFPNVRERIEEKDKRIGELDKLFAVRVEMSHLDSLRISELEEQLRVNHDRAEDIIKGREDLICHLHNQVRELEAELAEKDKKRKEWENKYKKLNTELMCELADPCGTIWEHATKQQKEIAVLKASNEMYQSWQGQIELEKNNIRMQTAADCAEICDSLKYAKNVKARIKEKYGV